MPRFTISLHSDAPDGDHYDLFLETGETLMTWRIQAPHFTKVQGARRNPDHRARYLDYEGEVSDERGRVQIWDTGTYEVDAQSTIHLRIALHGERTRTRLCFDHRGEEIETNPEWLIYDGASKLRRLVTHHLRGNPLSVPDDDELKGLHFDLVEWERVLAALADRFIRGDEVDWKLVEDDPGLMRRIRESRARWSHPWLVQAYRFAGRLDRWLRTMRSYRSAAGESPECGPPPTEAPGEDESDIDSVY